MCSCTYVYNGMKNRCGVCQRQIIQNNFTAWDFWENVLDGSWILFFACWTSFTIFFFSLLVISTHEKPENSGCLNIVSEGAVRKNKLSLQSDRGQKNFTLFLNGVFHFYINCTNNYYYLFSLSLISLLVSIWILIYFILFQKKKIKSVL